MNVEEFIADFDNGMSAKQLKEKYKLSNRKYNKLKINNKLKRPNFKGGNTGNNAPRGDSFLPKNYSKTNNGGYTITKTIKGKNTYFCHTNSEEKAKRIVEKFRECNWDINERFRIMYEVEKGI